VTRNTKAFGIAIGLFFLLAALNLYVFLIPQQGIRVVGTIDGEIDKEYYRWLLSENKEIDDISEIADILAEVYYLTRGEGIEQFRFTLYDEHTKPLRVRAFERIGPSVLSGLNWPNSDIYLEKAGAISFLKMSFHELGHGLPRSRVDSFLRPMKWMTAKMTGNLAEIECPAEANVIDSIVALIYLDPALGYLMWKNYKHTFSNNRDEYAVARNYSLYRCLEGGRVEEYPGMESLQEKIKRKTAGKTASQISELMHQGVLEMFKERFGNREDFEEKYSLLQNYLKYGLIDTSHDESFPRREDAPN
jgi:hypothetical protein